LKQLEQLERHFEENNDLDENEEVRYFFFLFFFLRYFLYRNTSCRKLSCLHFTVNGKVLSTIV
jgi:hypothetical protein